MTFALVSHLRRLAPVLLLALAACADGEANPSPAGSGPRGAGGSRAAGGPPPAPVVVENATRGAIASTYSATATLEAKAEAQILARVSGVVQALLCEEGDEVREGQALLQIDNEEYRFRLAQAEARTANLRARHDRLQRMVDKQLVSEEEFDTAVSDLASAEADEGLARLQLSYTTVRAPFRGRIVQRLVDPGQTVNVGTTLFRLAQFDPLRAVIHVPSKEFRRLRTEQPVRLRLDSDGRVLEGKIQLVSPVIDPSSGTIKVTVEIPSPPPGVRPGDFAQVAIVTERREDRVLVPREAVITDKGETVLFVAAGGQAERRVVETGFTDDDHVEILSGVEADEPVVVRGQRSLRHGQPVKVLAGDEPLEARDSARADSARSS